MSAHTGVWKGTLSGSGPEEFPGGPAEIEAILKDKVQGIYSVIAKFEPPYGSYPYEMKYSILKQWKDNPSASWYNNNIKGNTEYFPK